MAAVGVNIAQIRSWTSYAFTTWTWTNNGIAQTVRPITICVEIKSFIDSLIHSCKQSKKNCRVFVTLLRVMSDAYQSFELRGRWNHAFDIVTDCASKIVSISYYAADTAVDHALNNVHFAHRIFGSGRYKTIRLSSPNFRIKPKCIEPSKRNYVISQLYHHRMKPYSKLREAM